MPTGGRLLICARCSRNMPMSNQKNTSSRMEKLCKNCKHVSGFWCMRRKKSVKPNKDWCCDFKEPVEVRYELEVKFNASW